jgi:predicted negative regulator of RcsB-dependent stress response
LAELLIFLVIGAWFGWRWYRQHNTDRARHDLLTRLRQTHDAYLADEISDKDFANRSQALMAALRLLEARR